MISAAKSGARFAAIDTIQRHKQASHYDNTTNIGDGIKEARYLLDEQGRGAGRKTLIVMTDGNANQRPSGFALPGNWNWAEMTDYDGDGTPDYTTGNRTSGMRLHRPSWRLTRVTPSTRWP